MNNPFLIFVVLLLVTACSTVKTESIPIGQVRAGMPPIDPNTAIYELPVSEGVSYRDVVDSLKSLSEGKNFVNPANFPIGEHIAARGLKLAGVLEVRTFCNLGLGGEIFVDHPEFSVFAPCRIALYEKLDASHNRKLFLALARPTFDMKSIKNPTPRAKKAAQELETILLEIMDKARKGDW